MLKKAKMVLHKDSKNQSDVKPFSHKDNYLNNSKRHVENYCSLHMKIRLRQICKDEILSDIVMTGTDLIIKSLGMNKRVCQDKTCLEMPKYEYIRIDNF